MVTRMPDGMNRGRRDMEVAGNLPEGVTAPVFRGGAHALHTQAANLFTSPHAYYIC